MTNNKRVEEILAEMYGIGVGQTAKEVIANMHPNSFVATSIKEASQEIQKMLVEARLNELDRFNKAMEHDHYEDVMEVRIKELEQSIKDKE